MQPGRRRPDGALAAVVSILTGPEGPMQPPPACQQPPARRFNPHRPRRADATSRAEFIVPPFYQFQSSPAPKGRCNACHQYLRRLVVGFNPHRPRRADATATNLSPLLAQIVSILTGPEGPMQRTCCTSRHSLPVFQSSPAPKGRCNRRPRAASCPPRCFNPHRPRRADATSLCRRPTAALGRFNPHRPRRADATRHQRWAVVAEGVSILTGPEGPMQRHPLS